MNNSNLLLNIKHFIRILFLLSFLLLCSYFSFPADGVAIASHNNLLCIKHEREALLKFKRGIEFDNCGLLSSWGDHEDNQNCCQWRGIRCSNRTSHVIMINLSGSEHDDIYHPRCLQGKVSSSLVDLKHLSYLDLSFNGFHQSIPSFIGSLVNLKHLNLSIAGFSGEIPHQLGNLSHLSSLDLNSYYGILYVKNLSWLSRLIYELQ